MKLWHKFAAALFLVAVLPLGIAAWQIASRGASEVKTASLKYLASVGDTGLGEVRSYVERAIAEAKTMLATIAMQGVPSEERMRIAQSQLIGATVLQTFVVFNPEGESVQEMQAATFEDKTKTGGVKPPATLPEPLRKAAIDKDAAFSPVVQGEGGAMFLPMTVRVRDAAGEIYAFGWTAVPLAPLSEAVSDLSKRRFDTEGYVTLVDAEGQGDGAVRVIAASDAGRLGKGFAPAGVDIGIDDPKDLARDMTHTFEYTATEPRLGAVTPVVDPRWSGLAWGILSEETQERVVAPVDAIRSTALLVGGGFALAALLLGVFGGRRLAAPVVGLSRAAGRVAGGDFTVQVPVPGKDEVGDLAVSFNSMTSRLTSTIDKLKEATAAKERMATELAIGHNIQMSMVPLKFPAFPERKDFDVHAALKPAFEVGGDFYDFFLIDDDTLCVCIADVSGKGVPAALFMAVTRTLVKAHASAGASSDEILERVNDDLAKDNDACMFVTLFLGLLDLKTGVMSFTNAGHNPSYIKRTSGAIERLDQLHGPVVAAMEEVPYGSGQVKLGSGDTLLLYTDGVNEAMNARQELFTEERLAELIRSHTWSGSDGAVKVVLDDVWAFQGDAEQADDVTVVALRYLGR